MSKKNTKRALLSSILALVLCLAMLTGTTFAWFTDSVTSGKNQIVAGNLDVELYHTNSYITDEKVDGLTDLFTVEEGKTVLWEPGMVVWENFTVANEGNLALKYQLTINFENEVIVNGHGLSEVLKVAVVEDGFNGDRETAKTLDYDYSLASFVLPGELSAASSKTFGIVIYWEPTDHDNDYNMNNGSTDTLSIDLGIELTATQKMEEKDSFNNQYDNDSLFPAIVVEGANTVFNVGEAYSFAVPANAVADGVTALTPVICLANEEYDVPADITATLARIFEFAINIGGIKEDNTTPIAVNFVVPGAEEYTDVDVYHNGDEIEDTTYDSASRTVTFEALFASDSDDSGSSYTFVCDTGATVIPEEYTDEEAIAMITGAKDGAIIDGMGRVITVPKSDKNKWSMLIQNGITLRNVTLKAPSLCQGSALMIYGVNKTIKMQNVTFQNSLGRALELSTNARKSLVFENCTITGKSYVQGTNVTFNDCSFSGNINLEGNATNVTFRKCKFTASGAMTLNSKLTNILIVESTFTKTYKPLRLYAGMPAPVNFQLLNNTFAGANYVSPDAGVDYAGWVESGAWIENGNTYP